jgi:nitroimidazol reductase NimA-like FMN-containing flavoprotein (pyridoxamine 5'-phosphate oxidase superfamily)
MFKKMRRQDRELSSAETTELLAKGNYGVLSMVGHDDYGYGVPLNFVYTDGGIYFHCALEGQKLDSIRKNNKVSFCVVGEAIPLLDEFSMKYMSAIVFGRIREVEGDEKMNVLIALIEKYSTPEFLEKGKGYAEKAFGKTAVLRLDIEKITGKARR